MILPAKQVVYVETGWALLGGERGRRGQQGPDPSGANNARNDAVRTGKATLLNPSALDSVIGELMTAKRDLELWERPLDNRSHFLTITSGTGQY
jgi:hypothetical protein